VSYLSPQHLLVAITGIGYTAGVPLGTLARQEAVVDADAHLSSAGVEDRADRGSNTGLLRTVNPTYSLLRYVLQVIK
jgi:hypothetical protein